MRLIPVRQAARLLKKFPKQDRIKEMTLLTRKKDRSLTVSWQTAGTGSKDSAAAPNSTEAQKRQRIAYTANPKPNPPAPQILVIEDGYEHSQLLFEPGADLNRHLKAAFKREFPRSHQAYLVEKK